MFAFLPGNSQQKGPHPRFNWLPPWDLSHSEVGAVLAKQWQLPASFIEPIRFHHDPGAAPEGAARAVARVARLSGLCADIFVEHNPLWPISEG
jgi:hypothetical protein